jgi:tRNA (guanine37-N1)-methyltransferase
MRFDILSLFPEYFEGPFNVSIIKRALEKNIVCINLINIRDFAKDKHRKVDDRPYGGGPGMVMMPGPLTEAIRSRKEQNARVIYLSPQGKKLTAALCESLAQCPFLILVCGHYEGIDQRVIDQEVDEEISIGDYVLTCGCPAVAVLLDAVIRFLPGVLGHEESALKDSFQQGILKGPAYTRPAEFEGRSVPDVLKSGNHQKIEEWQREQGKKKYETVSRNSRN